MATPTTLPASFVSGAVLEAAQLNNLRGAFRVLQVVSTVKSDTFSTTSATFTDVTGLSATITPSATSSKILIVASVSHSLSGVAADSAMWRISGGNATNYVGDTAGNRVRAALFAANVVNFAQNSGAITSPIIYLDSPATTSATTYVVQARRGNAGTAFVNRTNPDSDTAEYARTVSSITVMEISAGT